MSFPSPKYDPCKLDKYAKILLYFISLYDCRQPWMFLKFVVMFEIEYYFILYSAS